MLARSHQLKKRQIQLVGKVATNMPTGASYQAATWSRHQNEEEPSVISPVLFGALQWKASGFLIQTLKSVATGKRAALGLQHHAVLQQAFRRRRDSRLRVVMIKRIRGRGRLFAGIVLLLPNFLRRPIY